MSEPSDPNDSKLPKPELDAGDTVEVDTAAHPARVALLFGVAAGALWYGAMWFTKSRRRWIAALVGLACVGALYAAFRLYRS